MLFGEYTQLLEPRGLPILEKKGNYKDMLGYVISGDVTFLFFSI